MPHRDKRPHPYYQSEDHYQSEWQEPSQRYTANPTSDTRERLARIEVQLEPVAILRDTIHRFGLRIHTMERDIRENQEQLGEAAELADRIAAIEAQIAFAARCVKWGLTASLLVGTLLGKLDWKWVAQRLLSWASAG